MGMDRGFEGWREGRRDGGGATRRNGVKEGSEGAWIPLH